MNSLPSSETLIPYSIIFLTTMSREPCLANSRSMDGQRPFSWFLLAFVLRGHLHLLRSSQPGGEAPSPYALVTVTPSTSTHGQSTGVSTSHHCTHPLSFESKRIEEHILSR